MLNANYISQLKEKVPLLYVVRQHLKSERVGILFPCPFCQKRNCNLIVNDARNWFSTSFCPNKGDVFSFLSSFLGINGEAVVEYLSDLSAELYYEKIPSTVSEIARLGDWKFYGEP